ncbi:hypothetical protein C0993_001831 [Termitomyces sp. T159_Od127]|nr:hypothetical protein C0993_001831 [Termitomyces sp. T159_Od127]
MRPPLADAFPTGPVLLLSYFYDRLSPLLPASTTHLTVHTIAALARRVCAGDITDDDDATSTPTPTATSTTTPPSPTPSPSPALHGRPEYCLDLTYMYALLRHGYDFPDAREVRIAKRVRGTELGWALGAALAQPLPDQCAVV